MTHDDNNTPIAQRIARLAAQRTDAQNDAIRRHSARISQDFRTGIEPPEYPQGYTADMDDFLEGLSQKWHAARKSAPNLEERTPAANTSFRPQYSETPDPFDDQEPSPPDHDYGDDNRSQSSSPADGWMKTAASALSKEVEPNATDVEIELEGDLVCIWKCGPNALVQYAELKNDPNSIIIREKRFFLNEYEEDTRFACIAGLSFDALIKLLK